MKKKWWIKLTNYEYWPMWAFYICLFPFYLIQIIKNRHLFFFTNVNPGIDEFGGLFFDSKNGIDQLIPTKFRAKSILVNEINEEKFLINVKDFHFPVILKPDNGERGKDVFLLNNVNEFNQLKQNYKDYLIQEYIDTDCEYGVFVVFFPHTAEFKITSLTEKKYFEIEGDGFNNIEKLILQKDRGIVSFEKLKNNSKLDLNCIPLKGEKLIIHKMGNHNKGTEFIDIGNKISDKMNEQFSALMTMLPGIQYGRFDVKTKSFTDLETFDYMKIMEFNGLAAEPIHIYDSRVGFMNAIKSFLTHHRLIIDISKYNKQKGIKPASSIKTLKKVYSKFFKINV